MLAARCPSGWVSWRPHRVPQLVDVRLVHLKDGLVPHLCPAGACSQQARQGSRRRCCGHPTGAGCAYRSAAVLLASHLALVTQAVLLLNLAQLAGQDLQGASSAKERCQMAAERNMVMTGVERVSEPDRSKPALCSSAIQRHHHNTSSISCPTSAPVSYAPPSPCRCCRSARRRSGAPPRPAQPEDLPWRPPCCTAGTAGRAQRSSWHASPAAAAARLPAAVGSGSSTHPPLQARSCQ